MRTHCFPFVPSSHAILRWAAVGPWQKHQVLQKYVCCFFVVLDFLCTNTNTKQCKKFGFRVPTFDPLYVILAATVFTILRCNMTQTNVFAHQGSLTPITRCPMDTTWLRSLPDWDASADCPANLRQIVNDQTLNSCSACGIPIGGPDWWLQSPAEQLVFLAGAGRLCRVEMSRDDDSYILDFG